MAMTNRSRRVFIRVIATLQVLAVLAVVYVVASVYAELYQPWSPIRILIAAIATGIVIFDVLAMRKVIRRALALYP